MAVDPYMALAVPPDASADQIRSAYRALAKAYHPDSPGNRGNSGVVSMFQQVTEAYDLLSDVSRRRKYDALRALLERKSPELEDNWSPGTFMPGRTAPSGSMGGMYTSSSSATFVYMGGMGAAPAGSSYATHVIPPQRMGQSASMAVPYVPRRIRYRQLISKIAIQKAHVNPLARYQVGSFINTSGIGGMITDVQVIDDPANDAVIVEYEIQP